MSVVWQQHRPMLISVGVALLVHLVLVFGVSFETNQIRPKGALPTLEILLVQSKPELKPVEDAEFLAEQNHQKREEAAEELMVKTEPLTTQPETPAEPTIDMTVAPAKPVAQLKPKNKTRKIAKKVISAPKTEAAPVAKSNLFARSLAMARLSSEVRNGVNSYERLPRQRHISANTREFKYAAYMEAWVKKVQRVGNLNYPAQARKENLTGSLILDVSLTPEGEIESIDFIKSSGFKILDDAAVNIVRMAAPYAVFPANIREETDLLHITRTWQFVQGNRLSGF